MLMSDQLLTAGNSVAAIDELYLWLSNTTVVTYIRNCLKRVRKKNSALILASQNLEDFDQPGIRELTRPLFSIPVHQFLFNGGNVDKKFFIGYDWIEYVAQIDDGRALSIGLTNLDCVPGTMPDVILSGMTIK